MAGSESNNPHMLVQSGRFRAEGYLRGIGKDHANYDEDGKYDIAQAVLYMAVYQSHTYEQRLFTGRQWPLYVLCTGVDPERL